MLDHMLNLASHREEKQNDKINKKYRPKYRNVEHREESHAEAYYTGLTTRVPKFVL